MLTDAALRELHQHGLDAISLSLDGFDAARHDPIRQVAGTFERTELASQTAREVRLHFQLDTLVCEETVDELAAILEHRLALRAL
jgi:MoaA/NifB/PqqE/SkfB family radical SAM enzyme